MRFIIPTTILAFTLFLSGCFHVSEAPVKQTSTDTASTFTADSIDTSDWQTYTNDEYGFSFRYPKNFTVTKNAVDKNVKIARDRAFVVQGKLTDDRAELTLFVDVLSESDSEKHRYGFYRNCTNKNERISYETCVQFGKLSIRYIVDPGMENVNFFAVSNLLSDGSIGKLAISFTSPLWLTPSELRGSNGEELQLDQIAYIKSLYGVSEPHNHEQIQLMTALAETFALIKK